MSKKLVLETPFFKDAINSSDNLIYMTDCEGAFTFVNRKGINYFGFKDEDELCSKKYQDLRCKAHELADYYHEQSQLTMQKKVSTTWLAIADYGKYNIKTVFYGKKSPIIDGDGKVTGIFSCFSDVTNHNIINLLPLLIDTRRNFDSHKLQNIYAIKEYDENYQFNEKESLTLFYFLRGLSSKKISQKIHRSSRTVEGYLESIKLKLKVENKTELVEKSIDSGLLNILPIKLLLGTFE